MVIVLPGTKWSEGLCKKIKSKGKEILLVSPEEHPYCEKYADIFYRSDIFDVDNIVGFCCEKDIQAVISDECDIAMPVVADLGFRFGVNTLDKQTASLFTDKYLMREFSQQHGIKYPEYQLCRNIEEALDFYRQLGKDIIIKPLDSNASHGVFRICSEQDLVMHFEETISFSRVSKGIIAERYISGTEFTVDGIKTPSKHYTLAISEKKHFSYNENIAYELFFSHHNEKYDYDKLRNTNDFFVDQSSLKFGFTHAEYKYENGEFYLIEIAARGGGNQISSIITQYMSGHDTYDYLVDSALYGPKEKNFVINNAFLNRASVLYFFSVPKNGGKVKEIKGEEFLKKNAAILDYRLNFNVGDTIHDAENDSVRIGYYIAGAENEDSLQSVMNEVNEKFEIILE
jgi:hypothetical protein